MARRIRSLKPEWLDDEALASLSDAARTMSASLMLLADDEGRGRGNLRFLASQIWAYHPDTALEKARMASEELEAIGYVSFYEVDGQKYFQIKNFSKHQVINRPSASSIPKQKRESGCSAKQNSVSPHGGLTEDSLSAHGAFSVGREGKGEEGNGGEGITREEKKSAPLPEYLDPPPEPEPDFTLDDLGDAFSAAREKHGGAKWQPALSRKLSDECRQALEAFRGEAKRKGKTPRVLAQESAENYCAAGDSWVRKNGFPPGQWLKDPLRYLAKTRSRHEPSPHEDFGKDGEKVSF